mgnify:FL=1
MKLNVESKKVLKARGKELVIEEVRDEKGNKYIAVRELTNAKLANGEYWQDDLSNVQRVTMKDLDVELRKNLSKLLRNI